MSTIVLPKQRMPATRFVPKIFIIYGMTKVGKTDQLSKLEDLLELDAEPIISGADMYDMMRITISSVADVINTGQALMAEKQKTGKNPYKYIAMDTIDGFEDRAIEYCTWEYNKGKPVAEQIKTVTDLDYGRGQGYVREKMKAWISVFANCCDHLIIVSHVKDKEITDKEGSEVSSKDLSLSGKLAQIVCSAADAIGYMYRDLMGNLRISFITKEVNPVMGTRFAYFAGKDIEFSWAAIFDPQSPEGKAIWDNAIINK